MKMEIFMVLRLFRYRIGMTQYYFHQIFHNRFGDIGFISSGLRM